MTDIQQTRAPGRSRLGRVRSCGGEIVEVQGGHIIRSIDRKDRHSKVCTAKGPRDRRVRLSAHTAIQFYDLQDRLDYDRPSKAVDWLIKNAKTAIDGLAELPPWNPTDSVDPSPVTEMRKDSGQIKAPVQMGESPAFSFGGYGGGEGGGSSSSSPCFFPQSLESDSIADTIKFFFPIVSAGGSSSSNPATAGFDPYPPPSSSHSQDLRLSLQSFHDPPRHPHAEPSYDAPYSDWCEQNQRLLPHNTSTGGATTGGGGGGSSYIFDVVSPPVFGHTPFLPQRGSLQSNSSFPSTHAWSTDPTTTSTTAAISGMNGFGYGGDHFAGFRIPARIQGEEEEELVHGISGKPSSDPRR